MLTQSGRRIIRGMLRRTSFSPDLPEVCRLGLATRGNTHLRPDDVAFAVERGLNYLNWCAHADGMSSFLASLGAERKRLVVAAQFKARGREEAEREFDWMLAELKTDRLDWATLYYVESEKEWRRIVSPGGAWDALAERKRQGALGGIGLTSHQRKLAAGWAKQKAPDGTARLDMLMVRYNAAHRGAEHEVFPVARKLGVPVVTFTGLRWRALLDGTAEDPPGFEPPSAAECYRFCLSNPSVAVALTAPGNRRELEDNLALLDDWRAMSEPELEQMRAHGDRVRRCASEFW